VTTYYRGPLALITHEVFVSWSPPLQRRYRLAQLHAVEVVRAAPDPGTPWYRRRRVWALVAAYQGHSVRLFATPDSRTFGQVRRALLRALEAHERY
jgi:hypothetical protein